MIAPNEIITKIMTIQLILDKIEVHGIVNAKAIAAAYDQCTELTKQIKDTLEQIQNGSKNEPEDGEIDAGNDTGLS